ncbi:MAG: U32 family peptidase, partial [Candidatus Saccharimonas sp.]|nr:U32 family peptidase [Planctomycetaceae bacterium]
MTLPILPRPELLAPAGDRECLRAAVENGADAVYFGLNCGFNARARATNIEPDELADVMAGLHHRGVKGYVTLNTLAFTEELPELERLIRRVAVADVDAVLVQDLGVVRLIRAICPDLPIHASTQMTLTSAECIRVAEELGIERVVLPRELSIREIAKLRQSTAVSLEAFVHGALCVAYSGQCLTSESLGGRSANRGQCAQACRLPYDLICDGEDVDLGAQKYLLSPQDLAAYDLTTDLIAAGVSSFKIEGRLKTPEYVANITKHYRAAIDAAVKGEPVEFTRDEVREMELSFSRGFSPGWLNGDDHKMLVPGFSSSKRGVLLGEIVRVRDTSVDVRLAGPIARGDGIVFEGDREANAEQGGRIFGIQQRSRSLESAEGGVVELEFQRGAIEFDRLNAGQSIWKTDDPQLTARLRKTFTGPDPLHKRPLDLRVRCVVGELLKLDGLLEDGVSISVTSSEPLPVATKHAITAEFLREQLSRLGNTVYELRLLDAEIVGGPMVPLSVLSKLRQELVARLNADTKRPRPRRLFDGDALAALRGTITTGGGALLPLRSSTPKSDGQECSSSRTAPRLHVLCRTLDQLKDVAYTIGPLTLTLSPEDGGEGTRQTTASSSSDSRLSTLNSRSLLYADFQDIREYRDAVAIAHEAGLPIYLATPRIQKPDEVGFFHALLKQGADGILVRNLAGMRFYADEGVPFVADYSLNATNELTAQFLIEQRCKRVTASYDMNRDQLLGLVDAVPPEWLEVVVHQHMPM